MNKLLLGLLVVLLGVSSVACTPKNEGPSESEIELQRERELLEEERESLRLEQERLEEEKLLEEEAEQRNELQSVIDALNAKIKEVESKGPTTMPSTPKGPVKGPGSANYANGPTSGRVTVTTRSASGSLTLRTDPGTNNPAVLGDNGKPVTISNGTSVNYTSYHDLGTFTWYKVEFPEGGGTYVGWVRGDYLVRQ